MANVADTILAQLGGNKFLAMTGAKNLAQDSKSLQFKLPTTPKNKINSVSIKLAGDDTYTMTFFNIRGLNFTKVKEVTGIMVDNLKSTFTSTTGLLTSLKGESFEGKQEKNTMSQAFTIQEYEVTGVMSEGSTKSVKVFSTDAKTAQIIASNKHKMTAKSAKLIDPSSKSDIASKTIAKTKQLAPDHSDI